MSIDKIGTIETGSGSSYRLGGNALMAATPTIFSSNKLLSSSSATSLTSDSYHTVQITTSHISDYNSSFAYELYLSCVCTVSTDEKTGYLAISPGSTNSDNGRVNVGGAVARTSAAYNAAHTITVVLPANTSYLSFYNSGSGTITYAVYLVGYRRMGTNNIENTVSNQIQSINGYSIGGNRYDAVYDYWITGGSNINHDYLTYIALYDSYEDTETEYYIKAYGDKTNPDASNFPATTTSGTGYNEVSDIRGGINVVDGLYDIEIGSVSLSANSASTFSLKTFILSNYKNSLQKWRNNNTLKRQNTFTSQVEQHIDRRIELLSTSPVFVTITGYSATPSRSGSCIIKIAPGSRTYNYVDTLNSYFMRTEYHSTSTYMCAGNIRLFDNDGYFTIANCSSNAVTVYLKYSVYSFVGC